MPRHECPELLLVEDNPGDAELFRQALSEADVEASLHVAPDGRSAREFLHVGESRSPDRAPVDLVVLDLDLPDVRGTDLLAELRRDDALHAVPTLILSSSTDRADVKAAYDRGANAYLTKRTDFEETVVMVESLGEFWFDVAELPSR